MKNFHALSEALNQIAAEFKGLRKASTLLNK